MKTDILKIAGASLFALSLLSTPALAEDDLAGWDSNSDTILDRNEFDTAFDDAGVFDNWDADRDGNLSRDEFNASVYDSYDADDSGSLEEPELGDLGDDVGDSGLWDV